MTKHGMNKNKAKMKEPISIEPYQQYLIWHSASFQKQVFVLVVENEKVSFGRKAPPPYRGELVDTIITTANTRNRCRARELAPRERASADVR